jgi:chromosome partitioning protein
MQTIMVYSEAGGVTKTTTAVSLAMCAAMSGRRVALADLDPRGAATSWIGASPGGPGLHMGAILGNDDPAGWFADLAVPSGWHPDLPIVPSHRELSLRESERADQGEIRLVVSLEGAPYDLVVIDCPNRQGGPLIQNALTAAGDVVYAAKADGDGLVGVDGARETVRKFKAARERIGAPSSMREAGIIVGSVAEVVMSRLARHTLAEFDDTYDGLLLRPAVPARVVVGECRLRNEWYGAYDSAAPVLRAYQQLMDKVVTS